MAADKFLNEWVLKGVSNMGHSGDSSEFGLALSAGVHEPTARGVWRGLGSEFSMEAGKAWHSNFHGFGLKQHRAIVIMGLPPGCSVL